MLNCNAMDMPQVWKYLALITFGWRYFLLNFARYLIEPCGFQLPLGQTGAMYDFLPAHYGNFSKIWCQIKSNTNMAQIQVEVTWSCQVLDKMRAWNTLNLIASYSCPPERLITEMPKKSTVLSSLTILFYKILFFPSFFLLFINKFVWKKIPYFSYVWKTVPPLKKISVVFL